VLGGVETASIVKRDGGVGPSMSRTEGTRGTQSERHPPAD
jgi:hypothetical protein